MTTVQTVLGPVDVRDLGVTLMHEHVLCDFVGADKTGPHRWDVAAVVNRMEPYLRQLGERGCQTLVDCTPMYIGRDVRVLRELSMRTGIQIVTNTGLYKEPFLPARAFELGPDELSEEWIGEWAEGIEGTGIRPGLIKIAVNPGPLLPVQQVIVRAAAITSKRTGLAVAAHTGHALAAQMSLDLAEAEGMDLSRYIVVHAHQFETMDEHLEVAKRGAWLEYDGISEKSTDLHVKLVMEMTAKGYGDQLLISHDAGWYSAGEEEGGDVRPYTTLFDFFLPRLLQAGADAALVDKLLVANPARVLGVVQD